MIKALVKHTLQRCKKYGHDQIQFNKALARNGIAWEHPPDMMNNGTVLYHDIP